MSNDGLGRVNAACDKGHSIRHKMRLVSVASRKGLPNTPREAGGRRDPIPLVGMVNEMVS